MTEGFTAPPTLGGEPRPEPASAGPERAPALPARPPRRPRRTGARLGWIIGGTAAVAIAGGVAAAVVVDARADALSPAERGDTGSVLAMAVVAGLCLEDVPAPEETLGTVTAVRCDEAHRGEAVAEHTFDGDEWPGDDAVATEALAYCEARVARVVTDELADAGLTWRVWVPTAETWKAGDRGAVCIVVSPPLTGSLEHGTAELASAPA